MATQRKVSGKSVGCQGHSARLGGSRPATARLAHLADSITRGAIGSSMKDLGFDEQRWLVIDIATPRELGHWGGVHQVCDSKRPATYMRISKTRRHWVRFVNLSGPGRRRESWSHLEPLRSCQRRRFASFVDNGSEEPYIANE